MKKIVIIIIISAFLLVGWSWHFNLNEYEEVCAQYQEIVYLERDCSIRDFFSKDGCYYRHIHNTTDTCVVYKLVRKVDNVEAIIYDYDWCEVYPKLDSCIAQKGGSRKLN